MIRIGISITPLSDTLFPEATYLSCPTSIITEGGEGGLLPELPPPPHAFKKISK